MNVQSTNVDLGRLLQEADAANTRMLDGDWSLWRELISHRDDLTLLGAYRSYVVGWEPVSARLERTAAGYAGGGGQSTHEHISSWSVADLACTVALEEEPYGRGTRSSALELDEQRRAPLARWMLGWLSEGRRSGGGEASVRLNSRGIEIIAVLLRLQVCRGEPISKVVCALSGEWAELADTYQRCATLPEAAERELDAARAITLRSLEALLRGQSTGIEPDTERKN